MRKIDEIYHNDIVVAYFHKLVPMIDLAHQYCVTRQAIWKILNGCGIDTSKGQRVEMACAWCGDPVLRVKSQIRGHKRVFCNEDCYFDWMKSGGNYNGNRHGQRIARAVVGQHFELRGKMIVHHEDGNTLNNQLGNLKVFTDHSTHMKYHFQKRAGETITTPILWDGGIL